MHPEHVIVTVHAKPSARQNSVEWIDDTTAKISVTAAPERGKANEAVRDVLAESLGVAKSKIVLIRGSSTRMKQFEILK